MMRLKSAATASAFSSIIRRRALKTQSYLFLRPTSSPPVRRKASRKRRLARLRLTARRDIFREAVIPGDGVRAGWAGRTPSSDDRRTASRHRKQREIPRVYANAHPSAKRSQLVVRRGQALTALGPASLQNQATALRRHARAEAVGLGAAPVIWLECSLRHTC